MRSNGILTMGTAFPRVPPRNDHWRRVAANAQTKPTDLGCESADWLLPSADTIAIYYNYSARKLILILPSHGRWKAEST